MPASKIKVELSKIHCLKTEGHLTHDLIFVTNSTDVVPKQGTQEKNLERLPSGTTWEFNNGWTKTPDEPLFSITDFEGEVELFLTMFDQDGSDSMPDDVVDAAVKRVKRTMDEVASAAAATVVGLPVAGVILAAKPFADAVGSILKLATSFDPSDELGTKRIRINTDDGPRAENIIWWAVDDGAQYKIWLKVSVVTL